MVREGHHRIAGRRCWALPALAVLLAGCGVSVHDLTANGDLERVEAMLDAEPSLLEATNDMGKTPLHYAVTYGQRDVAAALLERGAKVHAACVTGMTPLHTAAMLNRVAEAELLLAHQARIDARDAFGDTPLHLAAIHNQDEITGFLIEHGADPTLLNNAGLTPLDLARKHRRQDAIDLLAAAAAPGG